MIKLHSSGIASDYTEHGSVTTDNINVGQFVNEAISVFGIDTEIAIGGCVYTFKDRPNVKFIDTTVIDSVTYTSCPPNRMTFKINTKAEPKRVRKSGFVNLYRGGILQGINCGYKVFSSEQEARDIFDMTADCEKFAVGKIEWEEVLND